VLEHIYDEACEPEHVCAAIKRQTKILDAHYEAATLKYIIDSAETMNVKEKRDLLKWL
jgi:hypothetical protein